MATNDLTPYLPWLMLLFLLCLATSLVAAIIYRNRYEREKKRADEIKSSFKEATSKEASTRNRIGYLQGQRELLSAILPAEALSQLDSALENCQFTLQGEFTITGEKIEFG